MLSNYFITALRNLRRAPGFTSINVFGLAIGIAACLVIGLYIRDELSYDRYHTNHDRVYRVALNVDIPNGTLESARSSPPMAAALLADFPEVVQSARIRKNGTAMLSNSEQRFYEDRFYFADPEIFDILKLSLESGDAATALTEPFSVLLTPDAARRYFKDKNPVGRTLVFDGERELLVTGVIATLPGRSHFRPDFIASFSSLNTLRSSQLDNWGWTGVHTYVLLKSHDSATALATKLPDFVTKHVREEWAETFRLVLQPVTSIHLRSHRSGELDTNGNIRSLRFLGTLGLFVLLIACFNFVNLSIAQSTKRSLEVGIRKALGAHQLQLTFQFLGEAVLLSAIALAVAFVVAIAALPAFNGITGGSTSISPRRDLSFILTAVGLALLTGLAAGLYPSVRLARARAAESLKGRDERGWTGSIVRRVLVAFQFAIAIVLIVATFTIVHQLAYLDDADLGFDDARVAVIPMQNEATRNRHEFLKNELLLSPGVDAVSVASDAPGQGYDQIVHVPEGFTRNEAPSIPILFVDVDFTRTLGVEIVYGRNFRSDEETDAYLVNESAVRRFDWEEPIGKLITDSDGAATGRVVGVVRDFHYESFRADIGPMLMRIQPSWFEKVIVRMHPGQTANALQAAEQLWRQLEPEYPFQVSFLDSEFAQFYEGDRRNGRIIGFASGLAIVIACLGLFGLASYSARMRTREIGIRKVLGASAGAIVALLSREYLWIAALAFVAATPVAGFLMESWLSGFAFRIRLGPGAFLAAGLLVATVAFATVAHQAYAAARVDPVRSLRSE